MIEALVQAQEGKFDMRPEASSRPACSGTLRMGESSNKPYVHLNARTSPRAPAMSDVTLILSAIEQGDAGAASQLLPLIYDELRKLAALKLASEPPEQTLDATALVHEAYLRLVATPQRESGKQLPWNSRGHFFAAAAQAMRRILVENARRKKRLKHGGGRERVNFEAVASLAQEQSEDLVALDEALSKMCAI